VDYLIDIAVPSLTLEEAPEWRELRIPRGEINQVRVFFPPGCAGLVHGRILLDLQQIYPSNPSGWYGGDGVSLVVNDLLFLPNDFQTMRFEAYNDDDTFPHQVTFGVTVMADIQEGRPPGIPRWLWRLLRR
jgi:hypothetical protein